MDIQIELEKELKLLQEAYGCSELRIEWRPKADQIVRRFGKKKQLCGECIVEERLLVVYVAELEEALHVARHEFLEYYLETEIIGDIINMYNNMRSAYERTASQNMYIRKEAVIENMVKEIEKLRKNEVNRGDKKK